jgi:hypothetical protein
MEAAEDGGAQNRSVSLSASAGPVEVSPTQTIVFEANTKRHA